MPIAKSAAEVLASEVGGGTLAERTANAYHMASAAAQRAAQLGVSLQDVVSAKGQFDSYNKPMPPGTAALVGVMQKAIDDVEKYGPINDATFFSTEEAKENLPADLTPVETTATDHVYFKDDQNRAIMTAKGWRTPNPENALAVREDSAGVVSGVVSALFGAPASAPALDAIDSAMSGQTAGFTPTPSTYSSAGLSTNPYDSGVVSEPTDASRYGGALSGTMSYQDRKNAATQAVQAGLQGNVMAPSAMATDMSGAASAVQRAMAGEALDPRGAYPSALGREAMQTPDTARFMGLPQDPATQAALQAAVAARYGQPPAFNAVRPGVPGALPAAQFESMVATRPEAQAGLPGALPAARMQSRVETRPEPPAGLLGALPAARPAPPSNFAGGTPAISPLNAAPVGQVARSPLGPVRTPPSNFAQGVIPPEIMEKARAKPNFAYDPVNAIKTAVMESVPPGTDMSGINSFVNSALAGETLDPPGRHVAATLGADAVTISPENIDRALVGANPFDEAAALAERTRQNMIGNPAVMQGPLSSLSPVNQAAEAARKANEERDFSRFGDDVGSWSRADRNRAKALERALKNPAALREAYSSYQSPPGQSLAANTSFGKFDASPLAAAPSGFISQRTALAAPNTHMQSMVATRPEPPAGLPGALPAAQFESRVETRPEPPAGFPGALPAAPAPSAVNTAVSTPAYQKPGFTPPSNFAKETLDPSLMAEIEAKANELYAAQEAIPAVAPPTVVQPLQKNIATAKPSLAMPPAATAYDVYSGRATTALDNTGRNRVSRDVYGGTSVTNQWGKTTGMTPGGYQTAMRAPGNTIQAQPPDESEDSSVGSSKSKGAFSPSGALTGAGIGLQAGGPLGAVVGGLLGGFAKGLMAGKTPSAGLLSGIGGILGGGINFGGGASTARGGSGYSSTSGASGSRGQNVSVGSMANSKSPRLD